VYVSEVAMAKEATFTPVSIERISGSFPKFPINITLLTEPDIIENKCTKFCGFADYIFL
jgi:hypothetical protein